MDPLIEPRNQAQGEQRDGILAFVEEKFERRLSEEILTVLVKVSEAKADLIRWMFLFWIGQIAVISGILFAFFTK